MAELKHKVRLRPTKRMTIFETALQVIFALHVKRFSLALSALALKSEFFEDIYIY